MRQPKQLVLLVKQDILMYEIQSMVIKAHLNVKTSTELMYLTSIIADGIESKFSDDFNVKVLVYSQDDVEAIIIKDKGDSVKSYFMN